MRTIAAFLSDARDYARRAADHVRDLDTASFASDALRKDAVCFCLLIVGEACREAAKGLRELPDDIPWAEINGMRNILVHDFWQIDTTIIYNVARNEARPLADRLDRLIDSLP
jgi:uncharacterized protein with HEPN domain